MKLKIKNYWLVAIIIGVGILLRTYKLGSLPNSYTPDELAQGYTAYSLLQTGADEWGNRNPFVLQSFGDYKLPLQTWLMIPSIKIFGLTPLAVRFPNALISCISLIFFYLLLKKHFAIRYLIFGLLIFALSPWSIAMSRLALEANLLVGIEIIILYLLSRKNILFSSILLALSLSTYHSATILVPALVFGLIIFNPFKFTKSNFIYLILLTLLFALPQQISNRLVTTNRTSDIAIFHPTDNWQAVSDTQYQQATNGLPPLIARLVNNKLSYTLRTFTTNYATYFSPQFLATSGASETTYGMLPGFGVIGIILTIIFTISLIHYFSNISHLNQLTNFFLICTLVFPLTGALAKGSYSGNRVSLWLPILLLLIISLVSQLSKKMILPLTLLFFLESSFFLVTYFYQANNILAEGLLFGHEQANELIEQLKPDKVIYSRKLSEPQAYYLFFQKPEPLAVQFQTTSWREYQKRGLKFLDQLGEYQLDNVTFKEISIPADLSTPNTLIVGRPEEFHDLKPNYIINYPSFTNDHPAIYLYLTPKSLGN